MSQSFSLQDLFPVNKIRVILNVSIFSLYDIDSKIFITQFYFTH